MPDDRRLNQFGENSFDLTLRGHPESFADLNLGSTQLHNPGLWGAKTTGYHPWTWPNLSAEPDRMLALVAWVSGRLDEPIVEALQLLDDSGAPAVSREALRFLGPSDPSAVTFHDFVVDSGNGLDRNDGLWEPEAASRIAAARLAKWLERLVLAGQDFLVDAPHLISRFPSLLPGSRAKAGDWDRLAKAGANAEAIGMTGDVPLEAAYGPRFGSLDRRGDGRRCPPTAESRRSPTHGTPGRRADLLRGRSPVSSSGRSTRVQRRGL